MRTPFALFFVTFLTTSVLAEPQPRDNQTVAVGPWAIASIYKADKLESCTMSRPAGELGITFVRTQAVGTPRLTKMEARSRQNLFYSPRCRFAFPGCKGLG